MRTRRWREGAVLSWYTLLIRGSKGQGCASALSYLSPQTGCAFMCYAPSGPSRVESERVTSRWTQTGPRSLLGVVLLLLAPAALALPGPPHDLAAGIGCGDCHVPYGGISGAVTAFSTAGDVTELEDLGSGWTDEAWIGGVVSFTSGPNQGLFRSVVDSDADTVFWLEPLPVPVVAGDEYSLGLTTEYDIETQCKTCHNPTGLASHMSDVGLHEVRGKIIGCGDCHDPHNLDPNSGQGAALIREEVRYPTSAGVVLFPSPNASNDFIRSTAPFDGICETCHTETAYHPNDAGGIHDHESTSTCTDCHPHQDGFSAAECFACHNPTPPAGYELAPDLSGMGWDGVYPKGESGTHTLGSSDDCRTCHTLDNHQDGVVNVALQPDPNGDGTPWSSYRWVAAGVEAADWCLECHDDNNGGLSYGPGSLLEGWIDNLPSRRLTEGVNGTMNKGDFYEGMYTPGTDPLPNSAYPTYVHANRGGIGPWGCLDCHSGPHDMRFGFQGAEDRTACFTCHGGGASTDRTDHTGAATGDKLDSTYLRFQGGGLFAIESTHEDLSSDLLVCRQCHDPHRVSRQQDAPDGWSLFDPAFADAAGRSSTPFLGSFTDFCLGCHPTYDVAHTGGGACEDCHVYHGSSLPSLLWFDPVAEGVSVVVTPDPAAVPDGGAEVFTATVANYPAWLPPYAQWSLIPTGGGDPGSTSTQDEFPDMALGPPTVVVSDLEVTDLALISSLKVYIDVPHSWRGLLRVELTHDGTTVLLQEENMFDFFSDLVFEYDPLSTNVEGDLAYRTSPGPRRPHGDLTEFYGTSVTGTWTLTITDTNPGFGGVGYLDYWELSVNAGAIGTLNPVIYSFDANFQATYTGTGEVSAGITGGRITGYPAVQQRVDSTPAALTVTP